MKEYDAIAVGTGTALGVVDGLLKQNPNAKVAVIDKDEPGGICLTRGCIPSKLLLYPAEVVRTIEEAEMLGIQVTMRPDFSKVMERMRTRINSEIAGIRQGLTQAKNIDYYNDIAEFYAPYTLRVGTETITSKRIFLSPGSRPQLPPVKGLEDAGYLTSDTVLKLRRLPESIAIIGGGYIAAEYGHFFSAMGSKVTIVGRNKQFLPQEEPEVSKTALKELSRHMVIYTNMEALEAEKRLTGKKKIAALNRANGDKVKVVASEILVASGRAPNSDILHSEKAGIAIDKSGWIVVDEYLETSQPGIWAFGDAIGKHQFKHVANYESRVVYRNAVLGLKEKVDYHAVPHAVFTYPEIASVGLKENEAVQRHGKDGISIGFQRYEDTAKGEAMGVKNCFVKALVENETHRILGAHIIGPQASVLIQEIVNLMYTRDRSIEPFLQGMHIHPALSEVVDRAFHTLMPVDHYHHVIGHYGL